MSSKKKLREKILNKFVPELRESDFYQVRFKTVLRSCLHDLADREIGNLVCYGLGSISDGMHPAPRYQLALLILLFGLMEEKFPSIDPVIEIYDPCFTKVDKDTLESFVRPKFKLIDKNEDCCRKIDLPMDKNLCTLLYMPHLFKDLYNNLIGVNWAAESLRRMVILGNSFSEMINHSTPLELCKSDLYYLYQLVINFDEKSANAGRAGKPLRCRRARRYIRYDPPKTGKSKHKEVLIEHTIHDRSLDLASFFSNLSFHLFDSVWLDTQTETIQKHLLPDWKPARLDDGTKSHPHAYLPNNNQKGRIMHFDYTGI